MVVFITSMMVVSSGVGDDSMVSSAWMLLTVGGDLAFGTTDVELIVEGEELSLWT